MCDFPFFPAWWWCSGHSSGRNRGRGLFVAAYVRERAWPPSRAGPAGRKGSREDPPDGAAAAAASTFIVLGVTGLCDSSRVGVSLNQ